MRIYDHNRLVTCIASVLNLLVVDSFDFSGLGSVKLLRLTQLKEKTQIPDEKSLFSPPEATLINSSRVQRGHRHQDISVL